MGESESGVRPGVAAGDDAGVSEEDRPAGQTEDEALDEALRELFAESRAEEPGEPSAVLMSWCRRVSGLL